ncbi:MAG: HAD family hydrolase, partial [Nitrospinota bacterium]
MEKTSQRVTRRHFDAVLFDLDGVLTDTARVHASCWKKMFDSFLLNNAKRKNVPFKAFDIDTDYIQYVDGKPRYEGVESFLRSRGITLPYGLPESTGDENSVCGLGNLKTGLVQEILASEGVSVYDGSVAFV